MDAAATAASTAAAAEKEETMVPPAEDIPEYAISATVPLDSLVGVLAHGQSMRGDSHRFSTSTDPDDVYSKVKSLRYQYDCWKLVRDEVCHCTSVPLVYWNLAVWTTRVKRLDITDLWLSIRSWRSMDHFSFHYQSCAEVSNNFLPQATPVWAVIPIRIQ